MNKQPNPKQHNQQQGSVFIALLISTATFSIIVYSLLAIIATQFDFSFRTISGDQANHIAEAGINYYRWHLYQDPNDFQDGTGTEGPYLHDYYDPEGNVIGQYNLEITPPEPGYTIVTIKSTGWTNEFPTIKRTITARFGQTSYSSYAFLSNASLWLGTGITVHGRVHSNMGIRHDGINTSSVTSAQETYTCGEETGCEPAEIKPGVWGIGQDSNLWEYPVPPVDFNLITYDYGEIREQAISEGAYFEKTNDHGYQVIFKSDGTFEVYNIKRTGLSKGWSIEEGCKNNREELSDTELLGTYPVADNPVIFLEGDTWVSGVVNGRTTLVATRFPSHVYHTNIWINDNLTYLDKSGAHVLGLIANDNIIFARDVPDDFEVDAALMCREGRIMRYAYLSDCGDHPNAVRNSLSIYGSLISYEKSYWDYGTEPLSGFTTTTITYDPHLDSTPPPYYPSLGSYGVISWTEE